MSELKPCPFCGEKNVLVKTRKTTILECSSCGVCMFDYQDGVMRDVFAAWNRRAASPKENGSIGGLPA